MVCVCGCEVCVVTLGVSSGVCVDVVCVATLGVSSGVCVWMRGVCSYFRCL